jgi:hypothetical protein
MPTVYYDGVISSDLLTKETADGVLLVDLWEEAQTLIDEVNSKRMVMEDFLAYRSNMPEADQVNTSRASWMRRGEHARANAKAQISRDNAVIMAMESFETHLGYTRDAQVLGLSSRYLRSRIRGIIEADARNRYILMLERLFTKGQTLIVDVINDIGVNVDSLYWGTGDNRVPPTRGQHVFAIEHNHFYRSATEDAIVKADLTFGVNHLIEHGYTTNPIILVGEDAIDKVMAIGGTDVVPFQARNRYAPNDDINLANAGILMQISIGINPLVRAVGVFNGTATIMASPELPLGYVFFFSHEGDLSPDNPLQVKEPEIASLRGIRTVQDGRVYFVNTYWERYYSAAVRNPGNGVVMQWAEWDGGAYAAPDWGDY